MEEIRLLANLETLTDKLLPVVMAGQPELAAMLERQELRQLKQRVALRADLSPLGVRQVAAYVAGRLRKAGGDPLTVFTKDAIVLIHKVSGGIPRTVSVVCDNAMLAAFASGVKPIGPDIVNEVSRDFRLQGTTGARSGGHEADARNHPDKPSGPWAASPRPDPAKPKGQAARPNTAESRS
jgi:general secretion pathway protein A